MNLRKSKRIIKLRENQKEKKKKTRDEKEENQRLSVGWLKSDWEGSEGENREHKVLLIMELQRHNSRTTSRNKGYLYVCRPKESNSYPKWHILKLHILEYQDKILELLAFKIFSGSWVGGEIKRSYILRINKETGVRLLTAEQRTNTFKHLKGRGL